MIFYFSHTKRYPSSLSHSLCTTLQASQFPRSQLPSPKTEILKSPRLQPHTLRRELNPHSLNLAAAACHSPARLAITCSPSASALLSPLGVAVVGGGPAGTSAAEALASADAQAFLLERNPAGAKPCGGAIPLCMLDEFTIPLHLLEEKLEVDNLTLRRFLRARDHNVGKASAMFLKFLKWRQEAAPGGSVPAEQVHRELSDGKVCMGGVDRVGRPVLHIFLARHYSADRDMDEFKSFVVYSFDKICARIPRGQEKFLCVVDHKGWGYANSDVRAYIAAIEIMQNYYPERLGKALMIHVPYIFMKVWKMVYPFIDNNTREKFVFIDDKSLQETLHREIDESQLPDMYGGNMALVPLKNYMQPQAV